MQTKNINIYKKCIKQKKIYIQTKNINIHKLNNLKLINIYIYKPKKDINIYKLRYIKAIYAN